MVEGVALKESRKILGQQVRHVKVEKEIKKKITAGKNIKHSLRDLFYI